MKNIKEKILYSFLFFLFVFLDQLSKYLAVRNSSAIFLNQNFAFSLKVPAVLMYLIYVALLLLLAVYFLRTGKKSFGLKLGLTLIFAGALSNIFERIIRGYVIDFIHIHTGVLNFADFFIIFGILLLIFDPTDLGHS